ncbi:MAG TPA: type I phosphomannose isomerase catalytic subunit [Acidobacteriaceae bacterium]
MIRPFSLAPFFSPRPWGSLDLRPWYTTKVEEPIGEAWLTGKDCFIETGDLAGRTLGQAVAAHREELLGARAVRKGEADFPLLLKLLFPREKLSVQVHPDDAMATQVAGEPRGKTECWYVLQAEPGAAIALGLRAGTTEKEIRAAIAEKTLENLLQWIPVSPGDMIYVDAGTVHAIGPGVVLLETQQYSDLTYRLYDYGRPRELHVDLALRAVKFQTDAGKVQPVHEPGCDLLIKRRYFMVERYALGATQKQRFENVTSTVHSLVALNGTAVVLVDGGDPVELRPGHAVVVPASCPHYTLVAHESFTGVRAMPPVDETD